MDKKTIVKKSVKTSYKGQGGQSISPELIQSLLKILKAAGIEVNIPAGVDLPTGTSTPNAPRTPRTMLKERVKESTPAPTQPVMPPVQSPSPVRQQAPVPPITPTSTPQLPPLPSKRLPTAA